MTVPLLTMGDSVAYEIAQALGLAASAPNAKGVDCSAPGSGPAIGSQVGAKWADEHIARTLIDGGSGVADDPDWIGDPPFAGYQPEAVVVHFGGNSTILTEDGSGYEIFGTDRWIEKSSNGIVAILDDIFGATHAPAKVVVCANLRAKWYCDENAAWSSAVTTFGEGVYANVQSYFPSARRVDLSVLECCTADRADDCIHLGPQGAAKAATMVRAALL